jgi:hypothetical protein
MEKRKYLRLDTIMDAICRAGDALTQIKICNFSKEGVGILSREPFTKGDGCEIEMMIPGDNIPVIFEGEIAWTRDTDFACDDHKGGVRFRKISNDDRSRVLEHIYQKHIAETANKLK